MKNVMDVARDMNEFRHIMVIEFKLFELEEVLDVVKIAGDEIVHTYYGIPIFDEPVAQM